MNQKQRELYALALRIDPDPLCRLSASEARQMFSQSQKDREEAAAQLRHYAQQLETSGRWRLTSPTGSMSFFADTIDEVCQMAKQQKAM